MPTNDGMHGRIRRAEEMDDEVHQLSADEMARRDEVLALQVSRYQALAASHRDEEWNQRYERERDQIMRADEQLAAALADEERGLVGAPQYDREVAEAIAREPGGDNDFNFGGAVGEGGRDHEDNHDHGPGHRHGHRHVQRYGNDHDHDHGHDRAHQEDGNHENHGQHDLEPVENTREPLFAAEEGQVDDPMAEDLAQNVPYRVGPRIEGARCTACTEHIPVNMLLRTTCGHFYCGTCIAQLFRSSMTVPTLFPPRCCGNEIHLNEARRMPMFGGDLEREWAEKAVELRTPDRRCVCGHQFCYSCGTRWRTCACPQWQEDRLIDRAAQLVDRQPNDPAAAAPPPLPAPVPRQNFFGRFNPFARGLPRQVPQEPDARLQAIRDNRIQQMADRLQHNANCAHPLNWAATTADPERRAGCELCGHVKNRVYACRWCGIAACVSANPF
ncbi:hypothetical protein LTR86_004621 [Recurvomyces mirabilis]|nr:hypothetical protein LTR86_004621 [Recurvomyces mirabilis]